MYVIALRIYLLFLSPLQNSPLFQYLQDLGHTDFEACSPVSQEEELSAGGEERPFPQDILPSPRVSANFPCLTLPF